MSKIFNIADRKPIWMALSDFYLDTELQDSDFRYITCKIMNNPYTLDEVKSINKYEVFPVLQPNLLSVAGEWMGFEEEWLVDRIIATIARRNIIRKMGIEINYVIFKWMQKDDWRKLEQIYQRMKGR
ncbi:MAG: hypothetical protein AAGA66_09120 [Bacteroidota bacterium]